MAAARPVITSALSAAGKKHVVLVVDDDILLRQTVAPVLREMDLEVTEAASGDEALSLLQAGIAIDLIFSDVNMPGALDGVGLLQVVRAHYPAVTMIITSGQSLPPGTPPVTFVPKPYNPEQVALLIKRQLEGRQEQS